MPWWVRYEPLSYKIQSRSGNEQQFREMVEKCNQNNIRIIVDVVVKGGASEVTGYLNNLIDMGVAGFRFDASKQSAGELRGILEGAKDLRSDIFGGGKRPFAIHEVADGETSKCGEYTDFGRY
ncbi:hypothetical protein OESDEN_04433 [Oesophagostomum dentatum]|uniref:Uncharacterized protein n=1 Tax=Oesophagostomum dentatum TaxID=61180 RepID=A0A0B1TIJ1_OESDE|nr:hypothetical protein OESDEN_04433 [Oesophagostomum dentatum]